MLGNSINLAFGPGLPGAHIYSKFIHQSSASFVSMSTCRVCAGT